MVRLVWWLPFLLPCAHESLPGDDLWLDLGKVDLDHHTFFAGVSVPNLCYTVARSPDFEEDLLVNTLLCRCDHELGLLEIASRTAGQVGLVLLALRVGQVGAFIGV